MKNTTLNDQELTKKLFQGCGEEGSEVYFNRTLKNLQKMGIYEHNGQVYVRDADNNWEKH